MALTIKKPHVEVVPVIEPVVVPTPVLVLPPISEVEGLTAEYIDLYRKYDYFEVKALTKRMDEIRKQLHAIANETMDPAAPAVFTSPQGKIIFSERGTKTEIPNPLVLVHALLQKFGPEVTASVVEIALTPLRKLLSAHELQAYVTEQPGGRTLKAVKPIG